MSLTSRRKMVCSKRQSRSRQGRQLTSSSRLLYTAQVRVLGVLYVQWRVLRLDQTAGQPGNEETHLRRQLSSGVDRVWDLMVTGNGVLKYINDKHPLPTRILTCYWSEVRMCQRSPLSWSGTLMLEKTLKLTGGWSDGQSEKMRSHYFYPIFDRVRFCLPVGEKLDGRVECFLFTPFNKKYRLVVTHSCLQLHAWYCFKQLNHGLIFRFGTLYLSCNFACFSSHVPGLVNLVLPLKVAETEIIETFCWIVEFNFLFQLLLVSLDKICFLWCEECWKDWIKCWILCITKLRADL